MKTLSQIFNLYYNYRMPPIKMNHMRKRVQTRKDNYHQVFMCMTGTNLDQIANLNKLMGTDKQELYSPYVNQALRKTSDKFMQQKMSNFVQFFDIKTLEEANGSNLIV